MLNLLQRLSAPFQYKESSCSLFSAITIYIFLLSAQGKITSFVGKYEEKTLEEIKEVIRTGARARAKDTE